MKLRDFGGILLLGSIWGASYLFIKIAVGVFPPATLVGLRLLLAALVSLLVLTLRGIRLPRDARAWRSFAVMGLLNGALPYTLITWGEQHVDSGVAAILVAAVPIFTTIYAQFFLTDERLTWTIGTGIALGFVGVAVLIGPDALAGAANNLWGDLAIVGAAASYGLAIIWTRLQERRSDPMVATTGQLVMASLYMGPLALLLEQPWTLRLDLAPLTPQSWGDGGTAWPAVVSLAILAVFGTSLAYLLYYWLIARVGATQTSLVTYISPFTGILWGAALLGERLSPTAFVGFALILVGMGLITGVVRQVARRWGVSGAGR